MTSLSLNNKAQAEKRHIRRQFVDIGYGQLHLRIVSPDKPTENRTEPPLVCLHQSPKSGREFAQFIQFAGVDRITIAPDYPGYGESDRPPAIPAVGIEDYALAVWEALDALGHNSVDLFGNHTGDSVAVEMAYQQPKRVRNIAMISAPVLTAQEQSDFNQYFQPIPLDEKGSRFLNIWERICHYRSEGMTLELMAVSFAESLRGGDAYEWGHQAAFAYNEVFATRIAGLQHRIIVLNPADLLFEITQRVKPLLQNGQVIDLPEWAGAILNIHPEEVYKILLEAFNG